MTARDGAASITDKYGKPIPANRPAGVISRPPAAGGFWASIPSFGQELRTVLVIFAIAALVLLVARA